MSLGTRLRVVYENIMALVKDFYSAHHLEFEPRWFPLFRTVHDRPDIGMMALAQALGVTHAAINALCKALLEADLIELTPDPNDARVKRVRLSDAGLILHTRLEPAWHALESALNTALPDAPAILATLDRLDEAFADMAIPRALKSVLAAPAVLSGLEIVPYDPADLSHKLAFVALNVEWLEHYFSVEAVDWQIFADPTATILAPGGSIFMAKVSGQIVGTCALIRRSATHYELAKMAVSNLYQGKGIGKCLIAAVEDCARAIGLDRLFIVSSLKLPHAVPTYRKLGYVDCTDDLGNQYARADTVLVKALD